VIIPTTGDRAKNMHYALKNAGMFCMLYSFVKYVLAIAYCYHSSHCQPLPTFALRAARLVKLSASPTGRGARIALLHLSATAKRPNPIHRT